MKADDQIKVLENAIKLLENKSGLFMCVALQKSGSFNPQKDISHFNKKEFHKFLVEKCKLKSMDFKPKKNNTIVWFSYGTIFEELPYRIAFLKYILDKIKSQCLSS